MESDFPHLKRAPIREAVLDIEVDAGPAFTIELIGDFVEKMKAEFPNPGPIRAVQAKVDLSGNELGISSSAPETLGSICWDESKTRAVQARRDGFTVNHVHAYETWIALREQARRLWQEYVQIASPVRVVGCTLRYINRLELPVDIGESLLTRPEIAADLPQLLDDYFMRVVVPFANDRKAAVTEASEPLGDLSAMSRGVIVDIEAFSKRVFDIGDDAIWQEFEELRTIKNICFFKSLKPKIWETYR